MTQLLPPDEWNLERIRQLTGQNELERGRIEYKRELGNGHSVIQAVAALANTFGGVVLVGVDETRQGSDRIVGVDARERDRLARMCWDQLVPPFSPEIVPVKLDQGDKYVLAVVIDPDYARRPVMTTQGNKILVRIEGHTVPADWYRLRDLFAEQPSSSLETGLPDADRSIDTREDEVPDSDLAIRGRLLLIGPRGRPQHITEIARTATLNALNSDDAPLTGTGSALSELMHQACPTGWNSQRWQLYGQASTQQFHALWQGFQPGGITSRMVPGGQSDRRITEARLHVSLTPRAAHGDSLTVQLDTLLTNPRRPHSLELIPRYNTPEGEKTGPGFVAEISSAGPFLSLGALRQLMLDTIGILWGPAGTALSTGILGQPLGPPSQLDLTIFTVPILDKSAPPALNTQIDFGAAQLIPGNTPSPWAYLGPIQPDHNLLSRVAQAKLVHEWLIRLAIDNGYQKVEQEVTRWTGITT